MTQNHNDNNTFDILVVFYSSRHFWSNSEQHEYSFLKSLLLNSLLSFISIVFNNIILVKCCMFDIPILVVPSVTNISHWNVHQMWIFQKNPVKDDIVSVQNQWAQFLRHFFAIILLIIGGKHDQSVNLLVENVKKCI